MLDDEGRTEIISQKMSYFHPIMHGLTVLDAFRPVVLIALIWKAISHLKGEENPQYVLWVILHTLLLPRRGCSRILWVCSVSVKGGEKLPFGQFPSLQCPGQG